MFLLLYNANRQERRKCSLWHAKSPGVATSGAFLFRCGKVAYALGYLKLARLIEDEGFEHREFAKLVGMGESTLSTRLNPKPEQKNNEWRHYEITAICRELHIPQEQIGEYFFPKVEKGA